MTKRRSHGSTHRGDRLPASIVVFVVVIVAMLSSRPNYDYHCYSCSAWTAEWINLSRRISQSDQNSSSSSSDSMDKNNDSGTGRRNIHPPRSGHVAFGLQDKVYVFGGYAEEEEEEEENDLASPPAALPPPKIIRYATNDLWEFDDSQTWNKWKCIHPARLWNPKKNEEDASSSTTTSPVSTTTTTSSSQKKMAMMMLIPPQQRLAAAAASLLGKKVGLVLGGWDSQEAGTGGVILNDIAMLLVSSSSSSDGDGDGVEWKLLNKDSYGTGDGAGDAGAVDLGEPTSRLVAVPISERTVLVHNHRCVDHVLLISLLEGGSDENEDVASDSHVPRVQVTKQATTTTTTTTTTGNASAASPSPRGLHAVTYLPKSHCVVIFGGAAQSGDMSNEVFLLDCTTWQWKTVQVDQDQDQEGQPTPRASPCLVTLDDSTCLLFGGADRSLAEQGVPLHGCDDLWLLHLVWNHQDDDDTKSDVGARWERLIPKTSVVPPGRNAATLTPLPPKTKHSDDIDDADDDDDNNDDDDDASSQSFLLVGGWYPFRTTHDETYILKVKKE